MAAFLSKKVFQEFNLAPKFEGLNLGLEIEIEADKPLPSAMDLGWIVTRDGSLRGYSGEYVSGVCSLEQSSSNVKKLYSLLKAKEVTIQDSMRAGTHVHLNCLDLTLKQLFTLMAAYYCLEEFFIEEMGEERKGNLFCLRMSDAEYTNTCILGDLQAGSITSNVFHGDNYRYSAMNLVSLSKFGTLEFRALRTPTTPEPILEWINTLALLYHNSKNFETPAALLSAMSANGEAQVFSELLGKKAESYLGKPNFEETLYGSIRNIQDWVFLTDWSK